MTLGSFFFPRTLIPYSNPCPKGTICSADSNSDTHSPGTFGVPGAVCHLISFIHSTKLQWWGDCCANFTDKKLRLVLSDGVGRGESSPEPSCILFQNYPISLLPSRVVGGSGGLGSASHTHSLNSDKMPGTVPATEHMVKSDCTAFDSLSK